MCLQAFLLGHGMLFFVQVLAGIVIDQTGRCVDQSGIKISTIALFIKSLWTLGLYLQYAHGHQHQLDIMSVSLVVIMIYIQLILVIVHLNSIVILSHL